MVILRNNTQGQFVIVNMTVFHDRELKLIDRGLLTTIMSLPPNWNFSIAGLSSILPDGKDSIRESLRRLEEAGYLKRFQEKDSNGHFTHSIIEVSDKRALLPSSENPPSVKPAPVKRSSKNPTQFNNKQSNKQKSILHQSESLSPEDYNELVLLFGKDMVDYQINKIQTKHYKGCMNKTTISQWCTEYSQKTLLPPKNVFHNFDQRTYSSLEMQNLEQLLSHRRMEVQ